MALSVCLEAESFLEKKPPPRRVGNDSSWMTTACQLDSKPCSDVKPTQIFLISCERFFVNGIDD